eukprot:6492389-Amphidinium_carterae.2
MSQVARRACELRCARCDATGKDVSFILKGNVWQEQGKVFWNLAPLVDALLGCPKSFILHKWLRRDASELLTALGGLPGEHLRLSQRARLHHGSEGGDSDSQEYTISSYGLLHLFVWFVRSRRYEKDRLRGAAAFRAALSNTHTMSASHRDRCVCVHVRDLLSLEGDETESPQDMLSHVLVQASRQKCLAVSAWVVELCHHLCALLDTNACESKYEHSLALAFEATHSSGKRRRMDEDVRTHMLVNSGRAKVSSRTCLQLTAPQSLVNKWLSEEL